MFFGIQTVASDKGENADPRPVEVIYSEYKECFDILDNIYYDKSDSYQQLLKTNKLLIADMAGAVSCALFKAGFIQNKHFIEGMLECCRNTIISLGFSELDHDRFIQQVYSTLPVIVVVPGCQDARMLKRRVRSLVDFADSVPKAFTVVLSGRRPKTGTVRFPSEAVRMHVLYDEMMSARKNGKRRDITLRPMQIEEMSSTTKENIDFILKSPDYLGSRQNLVVISSTFHLIRIARHLTEIISENRFGIKERVDRILLHGAESSLLVDKDDPELGFFHDKDFVKLMMFDLYEAHIK